MKVLKRTNLAAHASFIAPNRYVVANVGHVIARQHKNETTRFLTEREHTNGYLYVDLGDKGRVWRCYVDVLTALRYVPRAPEATKVIHIDGNKHNNHFTNLRWDVDADRGSRCPTCGQFVHGAVHGVSDPAAEAIAQSEGYE